MVCPQSTSNGSKHEYTQVPQNPAEENCATQEWWVDLGHKWIFLLFKERERYREREREGCVCLCYTALLSTSKIKFMKVLKMFLHIFFFSRCVLNLYIIYLTAKTDFLLKATSHEREREKEKGVTDERHRKIVLLLLLIILCSDSIIHWRQHSSFFIPCVFPPTRLLHFSSISKSILKTNHFLIFYHKKIILSYRIFYLLR